jgi:hypothetical protein
MNVGAFPLSITQEALLFQGHRHFMPQLFSV